MQSIFDQIIDADFSDGSEDDEFKAAAKLPGATFRSVFGRTIATATKSSLAGLKRRYGLSDRETEAMLPTVILTEVAARSKNAHAQGLEGTPTPQVMERELRRADLFKTAYESQSGMQLDHPARRQYLSPALKQRAVYQHGDPRLHGHKRPAHAQHVTPGLLEEAGELHRHGVCRYVESCHRALANYENAERDRAAAQVKPVRRRGRDRGMER